TDVAAFEEALREARRARDDRGRAEWLEQVVASYSGELLHGFYEEWIPGEARRLEESFLHVLRGRVEALAGLGEAGAGAGAAAGDHYNESAHRRAIELLAGCGEEAAALRQYRQMERLLREGLDAAPSEASRRLLQAVGAGKVRSEVDANEGEAASGLPPARSH